MAANGISTLLTKQARQTAKLVLAASDRLASSNPRATYDIGELPTTFSGNTVVDNTGVLIPGRPWSQSVLFLDPQIYPGTGTTWLDSSGDANNATLVNGVTYTNGIFVLDGTNQYINIPAATELNPTIGSAFTMMLWAKVTSWNNGDGIMGKMFGAASYDGYCVRLLTDNKLDLVMNGSTLNQITPSASSNVWQNNTWHLFTAVIRFGGGSGNPSKVYVDGTEVISVANTESGIPSNNAPARIGHGVQDIPEHPAMQVGGFYLYNRAVPASEIDYMYKLNRYRFN